MTNATLGKLITDGERRRDAVHVPLAPVTAGQRLLPGEPVKFDPPDQRETVGRCRPEEALGVVDPFLVMNDVLCIEAGERFYICLPQGKITDLRHVWFHKDFAPPRPVRFFDGVEEAT